MHKSTIVDRLQLLASVSVLIGIVLVAYEIRQTNVLAEAGAISDMQSGMETLSIAEFETEIARLRIKSINEPKNLTEEEIVKLDAWLSAWLLQVERRLEFEERGLTYGGGMTLDEHINLYFELFIDNEFARVWYSQVAREWLDSKITVIFDRRISDGPINPANNFVERIQREINRE